MEAEKKPTLSVDAEGTVLKCAKGADVAECGYKGGPVCPKCGATPVQVKMVPLDELDEKAMTAAPMGEEDMEDDEDMDQMPEDDMESEDEESMDEEKSSYYKKYGWAKYKKKYGKLPWPPKNNDMDPEEDMEETAEKGMSKPKSPKEMMDPDMVDAAKKAMASSEVSAEDEEDEEYEEDEMEKQEMMRSMRKRRLESMGMKVDEMADDDYVCAIERKSHPGGMSVCDDCPGGCISEKGLPGLLEIEGLAETEFKGIVIDSGYSSEADMFVVDVQVKDGSIREVFIDGTTAEIVGFHKLDDDVFEKKSAIDEMMVIGFVEAAEIAIKSIEGTVVAVEPDVFEGIDSYAVEIDGIDGKSYDVFVALDGEVLGYDRYEPEEAEDIEAEAAEIALKRAFSEEKRTAMAKEGTALPDGSFPISSEEDLRNAIQAFGRAKDKEAAKRHIMKRAREMGKENLIPANWVAGGEMKKKGEETEPSTDADFMKSLIEFELLQADENI